MFVREGPKGKAMGRIEDNVKHPDLEDIIAYVGNDMSDEEMFDMETHIADCDYCAQRVRAHLFLRTNFDQLLKSLPVLGEAEAAVTIPCKEPVAVEIPARLHEFGTRIRDLLTNMPQHLGAVLMVAIDAGKKKVRITAEGLEAFSRAGGPLRFEHVPVFVGRRPLEGDATGMEGISSLVRSRGRTQVEINADAALGKVTLTIKAKADEISEGEWPLAVLVPQKGGEARAAELKPAPDSFAGDEAELHAEFEDVEGEHILFLEARGPFLQI